MPRRRKTPPAELWKTWVALAQTGMEAQAVIGMRVLGMAGWWALPHSEFARMVTEKQLAFTRAALAAGRATGAGRTPAAVLGAAVAPVGRTTRANARRLGKRGPTLPGAARPR